MFKLAHSLKATVQGGGGPSQCIFPSSFRREKASANYCSR